MNVTLINPYTPPEETYSGFSDVGSVQPPLGLCYIAAFLEQSGIKVRVIDAQVLKLSANDVSNKAKRFKSDIVGIYSMTTGFHQAKACAEKIKDESDIPILLGGPHVSGFPDETMQIDLFDYGVIGEGERTCLELVDALEKNKPVDKVSGIALKRDGKIVKTKPRAPIKDIDSLPFPARHLLPSLKLYKSKPMDYRRLPITPIITSRGCPYQCIFCDKSIFGGTVRFHSPEYVVNEVEELLTRYGIKEIKINDDTFIIDKKRVLDICDLIKDRGLDVSWGASIRADLIDEELLWNMKAAGCWEVFLGIESGNQDILDLIKKNITLEQAKRACEAAYKLGFQIKTSFIIGHPTETKESIEETINFAKILQAHYPSFTLMTPFPNTELMSIAEEYGTVNRDWSKMSTHHPVFVPKGLSEEYLVKKQKEAFKKCYFNYEMLLRHLKKIRSLEDIRRSWLGVKTLLRL